MDILKLLPSLPEWVSLPIIIVTVVVTLWPKILTMIQGLSSTSRTYTREKQRLELLKLHYEIEAIKKTNELSEIDEGSLPEVEELNLNTDSTTTKKGEELNFWRRLGYGAAGSLIPVLINLIMRDVTILQTGNVYFILVYTIRLAMLLIIAGYGSALISKKNATPPVCFLIGLSISLLLSLILTDSLQQSRVEIESAPAVSYMSGN